MIIGGTRQNLCHEIGHHVFGDTEDKNNITSYDHSANKMIPNLDMSYLTHLPSVGSDALASLRISIQRVGSCAKEAKKTKHILHVCKLLAAYTGRDKLRRTCGISSRSLGHGAPHNGCAIHKDRIARCANLHGTNSKRSICICDGGESRGDR